MHEFILHIPELANSSKGYNFLEDLLKIGLPSLVAIVSTTISYQISVYSKKMEREINSLQHKNEKEKYLLDKKINTIELASDKLEEFFYAIDKFLGTIGGITRVLKESNRTLNEFNDSHRIAIKEKDDLLVISRDAKNYAFSRFHLLGADKVITALETLEIFVNDFRGGIMFENKYYSYEEFQEKKDEFRQLKRKVYEEINKFYNTESLV